MSRSQPSPNLYSVEVVIPTFEDPSDDALVSEFKSKKSISFWSILKIKKKNFLLNPNSRL